MGVGLKRWLDAGIVLILACSCMHAAAAAEVKDSGAQKVAKEITWSDEDESDNSGIGAKHIIGMVEKVLVDPGDLLLDARIDTGANKTSLDAQNLQIVNEDGQDWAMFSINGTAMRGRVVKYVRIKQHGTTSQRRPVIMLKVTLGSVTQNVNATLTDRSNFKYKMLVGVNFLKDHFIVDVSQKYLTKPVPSP